MKILALLFILTSSLSFAKDQVIKEHTQKELKDEVKTLTQMNENLSEQVRLLKSLLAVNIKINQFMMNREFDIESLPIIGTEELNEQISLSQEQKINVACGHLENESMLLFCEISTLNQLVSELPSL